MWAGLFIPVEVAIHCSILRGMESKRDDLLGGYRVALSSPVIQTSSRAKSVPGVNALAPFSLFLPPGGHTGAIAVGFDPTGSSRQWPRGSLEDVAIG